MNVIALSDEAVQELYSLLLDEAVDLRNSVPARKELIRVTLRTLDDMQSAKEDANGRL